MSAIAAECRAVAVGVAVSVPRTVFAPVAELIAVAVVSPAVCAARIRLETFATPHVLACYLRTVLVTDLVCQAPASIDVVVAISPVVSIIVPLMVPVLGGREAGTHQNRQPKCCHTK